ncbi:hypothetical protein TBR22_A43440 [Luteitalea sp. TBR-22]|nr:hypothetical protein TBR22_A43440 [Luteitalea sp. TBR-22]
MSRLSPPGSARYLRGMCQRVQCEKCGKPSWVGCGKHVEQVLGDVPPKDRCQCPPPKSLLDRILGR